MARPATITRMGSSAGVGSHLEYLQEVLLFWRVFLVMAGRDILVRYRYAAFGVSWAVLRPFLVLVTFSAIFRGLVAGSGANITYSLTVLCAAPLWIFFSATVQDSINFVLRDAGLINRVYFPRILLVFSGVSVGIVDFMISLSLVVVVLSFAGVLQLPNVLLLPLAIVWSVILVAGCSLWVATLNARYRDVSNLVPFSMHLLLVLSPIGYSARSLPSDYLTFLAVNPLVGLSEVFRYCLLGHSLSGEIWTITMGIIVTLIIAGSGYLVFRGFEPWINDYA